MNTKQRCGFGLGPAILALCLVGLLASTLVAQETAGETVRVCSFPSPGFFTRDALGAASGFEYDLVSGFAIAAKLKVTFDTLPLFDQLMKDTESGKCQIGAAAVTVTGERQKLLDFSTPYFPNRVVVVQKTSTSFAQPADLKAQRVAVVRGTVSTGLVSQIPGVKPVLMDDDDATFQALLKGETDALACDSAVVLHYLTQNPNLAIAFPLGERSFFAFAFPKGSKLVGPMNDHIRALSKSGAITKLLAKHFGEANAEILAEDVVRAATVK